MTCREKLKMEHPEKVGYPWNSGCCGCPHHYGYLPIPNYCPGIGIDSRCIDCWNREIPGTERKAPKTTFDMIRTLLDDAMAKRDRTITISVMPDGAIAITEEPWVEDKE